MIEKVVDFFLKYDVLKSNYEKYSKIGQVIYPLKTNSNETIIKELINLYGNSNNGFAISHISHYNELIKLGVSPDKMCLINVIADDDVVKYFYDNGVRYFVFDNINSLQKFLSYANPNEIKIAVRLNIIEVFGVYSHLGAKTSECYEMLDLLKKYNISNFGISFYLQKETLPEGNVLNTMLDYIKTKFSNYNLEFLNIGGAIKPEEIDINKLEDVKKSLNAKYIIVEPGRYLVGNAGYMETTIIKKKFDNTYIIRNGIYAGLLDCLLYNKKFELYLNVNTELVKLEYEPFEGSKELIICGASSDSGDRIGKFYVDSSVYDKVNVGTKIIIDNALAYVEEFFMPLGGDLIKKYHIISDSYYK